MKYKYKVVTPEEAWNAQLVAIDALRNRDIRPSVGVTGLLLGAAVHSRFSMGMSRWRFIRLCWMIWNFAGECTTVDHEEAHS